MPELNQGQQQTRQTLRTLGLLITVFGGALTLVGFISFFSAFGSFGMPRYFWCAFVGLPLVGLGTHLMRYGYMGAVTRYVAGEVVPVAKDSINYLLEGQEDAMQLVGKAVGAGLASANQRSGVTLVRCHKCTQENQVAAKFCSHCGAALTKEMPCPQCGQMNDADAKFCDECGFAFTK